MRAPSAGLVLLKPKSNLRCAGRPICDVVRMLLLCVIATPSVSIANDDCVVLLHGLGRSANSMNRIEETLIAKDFEVANINYPSRKNTIEHLAPEAVGRGIEACKKQEAATIHFVTHSMGGILVRYFMANNQFPELGHVVMIAPPNQGGEIVDNWRNLPGYVAISGTAGLQLGTDDASVPKTLGPVKFSVGVIAGNRTYNLILSMSLPNPDDGRVSVAKTKVEGMSDFIEMPHTHSFIMRPDDVIRQALHYLEFG